MLLVVYFILFALVSGNSISHPMATHKFFIYYYLCYVCCLTQAPSPPMHNPIVCYITYWRFNIDKERKIDYRILLSKERYNKSVFEAQKHYRSDDLFCMKIVLSDNCALA